MAGFFCACKEVGARATKTRYCSVFCLYQVVLSCTLGFFLVIEIASQKVLLRLGKHHQNKHSGWRGRNGALDPGKPYQNKNSSRRGRYGTHVGENPTRIKHSSWRGRNETSNPRFGCSISEGSNSRQTSPKLLDSKARMGQFLAKEVPESWECKLLCSDGFFYFYDKGSALLSFCYFGEVRRRAAHNVKAED